MNICEDRKEMVRQIIRAQSTARRVQLAKKLFNGQAGVTDALSVKCTELQDW